MLAGGKAFLTDQVRPGVLGRWLSALDHVHPYPSRPTDPSEPATLPAMTGAARDGHPDPSRCGPPTAGAGTLRCKGLSSYTILYRSRSAVPGPRPTLPEVKADPTRGRGRPYPRSGALPDPSGPDGGPTVHAPWGIPYCIQDGMAAERTTPAGSCGDPACPQPAPGLTRGHREPAPHTKRHREPALRREKRSPRPKQQLGCNHSKPTYQELQAHRPGPMHTRLKPPFGRVRSTGAHLVFLSRKCTSVGASAPIGVSGRWPFRLRRHREHALPPSLLRA